MIISKIEKLAAWFILLSGWRRHFSVFVAGSVSALAMAPFDLGFVLFLTFPVLVWALDGAASEPATGLWSRLKHAFKCGFFFGFGYFLSGLWWIGNAFLVEAEDFAWAMPIAVVSLPALLACFWGCATAFARLFWRGELQRLFILAASFALFEYLRGFVATGFPWNAISYAVYPSPLFMQSASIFGVYGMTAFAVFCFSSAGMILPSGTRKNASRRVALFLVLGMILAHSGYGYWRISTAQTLYVENISLRLIQPVIDQREKWVPGNEAEIFNRYLSLSTAEGEDGKKGLSGTTHLIWPESAFPFLLTERRDALAAISAMLPEGTSLITGAARVEHAAAGDRQGLVFNSVYVIGDKGEIITAGDKVHLVPFGEYLPFQKFAESLGLRQLVSGPAGFEAGSSRKLLSTGSGPDFLPLICYEIIFSGMLKTPTQKPGWLLNLTNDAWFGNTPGPYQHLRQSVLRGVEEGLPVIRVANSGISSVSDPYGRIISYIPLNEKGVLDSPLPDRIEDTIFARFGGIIGLVVTLVFFAIGLFPIGKFRP